MTPCACESAPGVVTTGGAAQSRLTAERTPTLMAITLPGQPPVTVEDRVAALETQIGQLLDYLRAYTASREGSRPALTLIRGGKR